MGKIIEVISKISKSNFGVLRGKLWIKTINMKCKLGLQVSKNAIIPIFGKSKIIEVVCVTNDLVN